MFHRPAPEEVPEPEAGADEVEKEASKEAPPSTVLRQQVTRERIDPFEVTERPQQQKSVLARLMSFRRQQSPPPDSIQSRAVGLYGAQATMLIAGIIGQLCYIYTLTYVCAI